MTTQSHLRTTYLFLTWPEGFPLLRDGAIAPLNPPLDFHLKHLLHINFIHISTIFSFNGISQHRYLKIIPYLLQPSHSPLLLRRLRLTLSPIRNPRIHTLIPTFLSSKAESSDPNP